MKYEWKITGINIIWISAVLTGTFLAVCATGGDNINWGYLGFEVIFPFYTAVAVGEWCKTRTDPMFYIIFVQEKSLFNWIARRFVLLFGVICLFVFIGILGISVMKRDASFIDLSVTFLPTALFLSSICVFISLLGAIPHIPAMTVGILWLFSIMTRSLLRFRWVCYFYLFIRYAGITDSLWIVNKMILLFFSIVLWGCIAILCRNRTVFQQ